MHIRLYRHNKYNIRSRLIGHFYLLSANAGAQFLIIIIIIIIIAARHISTLKRVLKAQNMKINIKSTYGKAILILQNVFDIRCKK